MLYQTGITEVFACTHSLNVFGIEHKFVHLDNTSFSLEGVPRYQKNQKQFVSLMVIPEIIART
jgi:hypothetical protein